MSLARDTPSSTEERWGITKEELRRRERLHPNPTNQNERECSSCGYRVTKTQSGREVGHANGRKKPMCPEHPESDGEAEQTTFQGHWGWD